MLFEIYPVINKMSQKKKKKEKKDGESYFQIVILLK